MSMNGSDYVVRLQDLLQQFQDGDVLKCLFLAISVTSQTNFNRINESKVCSAEGLELVIRRESLKDIIQEIIIWYK